MTIKMETMKILPGLVGAKGVVVGTAHILARRKVMIPKRKILASEFSTEVERFKNARRQSINQLHEALVKASRKDHRIIIESHMMLTTDEVLFEEVQDRIEQQKINTEWALERVMSEVLKPLNDQDEQYFRERRTDLEHVTRRLQNNLLGLKPINLGDIREPVILVAHDISPADMAHIKREFIIGIITDVGGSTGHSAILARGMRIPYLVGVENATSQIRSGTTVILDAIDGKAIVDPPQEIVQEFQNKRKLFAAKTEQLLKYKDLPSVTLDNHSVVISANIELAEEVPIMLDYGIHSVGLFRTEFSYLTSSKIPDEEEQYLLYKSVLQKVGPQNPVTMRTLDVGADKVLPDYSVDREANPALGARGIRFSQMRPDIFRQQIRALLRASVHGDLRVMFPMISTLGEVLRAKEVISDIQNDLDKEGIEYNQDIQIGIMMEVPSAALIADVLAKEVDFFSIGTNDLIQYMMAVDRVNVHVNYLYSALHPSILRVIDEIVRKGHEAGLKVSMCGEMAGEIHFLMLLVGLGLDELSMPVTSTLQIKQFLRNLRYYECMSFAQDILSLGSSADVRNHLFQVMSCRYPEIFPAEYWDRNL